MDLVDQRNDARVGRRGDAATSGLITIPHACPCALVPRFQTYGTSRAFTAFIFFLPFHLRVPVSPRLRVLLRLTAGTDQQVELVSQDAVREATRAGIEHTRADRCVIH